MSGLNSLSGLNIGALLGDDDAPSSITEVQISTIHEDPNNPRKVFNDKNLVELSESISKIGVLCPISIKKHPELEGSYMINHGHRRFRAAKDAGLKVIPAFLDDNINNIGQFLENIQREDLTPLDIANWLSHTKETQGLKNGELAYMLSKSDTWVSRHLSIIDAEEDIKRALSLGFITSVEAAVSLSKAFKDHPEAVTKFIEDSENGDITQKAVREFIKSLNNFDDDLDTNGSSDSTPKSAAANNDIDNDIHDADNFDDDLDTNGSSDSTPKSAAANNDIDNDIHDADNFDDDLDTNGSSDSTPKSAAANNDIDNDIHDADNFDDDLDSKNTPSNQRSLVEISDIINILKSIDIDSELSKDITNYIDDNHSIYNEKYNELRSFLKTLM